MSEPVCQFDGCDWDARQHYVLGKGTRWLCDRHSREWISEVDG